jgi:hypothetical protein
METRNRAGWMTALIIVSIIVAVVFIVYLGLTVFRIID